jgi:hypothetical protein
MSEPSFALIKAGLTLAVLGAFITFMVIDHRRNLPTPREPQGPSGGEAARPGGPQSAASDEAGREGDGMDGPGSPDRGA